MASCSTRGILDQRDQHDLQWLEAADRKALHREDDVRRRVRRGCAVQREARLSRETAIGLRQADGEPSMVERRPALALLVMDHRPQLDVAPPERAQVKRQAPLDIGEHGLVAFRPQQRPAFFAVELEIARLRIGIAHVRLHAEQRPAAQAFEAESCSSRLSSRCRTAVTPAGASSAQFAQEIQIGDDTARHRARRRAATMMWREDLLGGARVGVRVDRERASMVLKRERLRRSCVRTRAFRADRPAPHSSPARQWRFPARLPGNESGRQAVNERVASSQVDWTSSRACGPSAVSNSL